MSHETLYESFTTHLAAFAKHRGFIDKANALADKFRPEVVKVVVDDHTDRSMEVVQEIMTVLFEVESTVDELETEKAGIESGAVDQRAELEELELNLMIEAISQEDFDAQSAALKGSLEEVDTKVGAIDSTLADFRTALAEWNELGTAAGVLQGE
ncbi:MAG: hypothetical protein KC912_16415 [Proteobacteria bacterium]|nr:hypothetical protein [Pseudomonadota bacterium]